MAADPLTGPSQYVITDHARWEMGRRNIAEAEVQDVLKAPGQTIVSSESRVIFQSKTTTCWGVEP